MRAELSQTFLRIEGDRGASVDGNRVQARQLVAWNSRMRKLSMRRGCDVADWFRAGLVDPVTLRSERPVGDGLLEVGQPAGAPPQYAERGWSSCRTPRVFHSIPVCWFLAGAAHLPVGSALRMPAYT